MKIDISHLDEQIIGCDTPDPLRYSFRQKTAAHAGATGRPVEPQQQQRLLSQLMMSKQQAATKRRCLYIHIPFCRVRCTFCSFFQYAASADLVDEYLHSLWLEMAMKADNYWVQRQPFDAVYVGGGTPTDLSADQLALLGENIRRYFPLRPEAEITLEGRLNGFSDEKYFAAVEHGFNRFSFGVQSFNTQVRKAAKRLDERETVITRLQQLSQRPHAAVIIDLLYGLPHQSCEVFLQDIDDFLLSGADGIDLYQLIEMSGTPMERMVLQGRLPAPANTAEKASLYVLGHDKLRRAGFNALSTSHWAQGDRERSIYNSLAKSDADILPLGVAAGGSISGNSLVQHRDINRYHSDIRAGIWPVSMMFQAHEQYRRNALITSAFDVGCLRQSVLAEAGYPHLFAELQPLLSLWHRRGLLVLEDNIAELTLAGRFWCVNLAQAAIVALSPIAMSQARPHGSRPLQQRVLQHEHH